MIKQWIIYFYNCKISTDYVNYYNFKGKKMFLKAI